MNEVKLIAEQVASGFREGAWPDVSVRDLLRSLTFEEAAAHPVKGAHSAWEIALPISYWHQAVRKRLEGEAADYGLDEDWPEPGEPAESNWHNTLEEIDKAHGQLVDAVRALDPDKLSHLVPGRSFTFYFMLHGVPQHDLYHGGQIMLLTRAVRGKQD